MLGPKFFICLFSFFCMYFSAGPIWACEMCTIPALGKQEGHTPVSEDGKWFFKYLFEVQNWHEKEAAEAHELHHAGHHFHDKTEELVHHYTLGRHLSEDLIVLTEVPYVIRHSLEVDSHAILGHKQESQGLGDAHLIGMYRFWNAGPSSASLAGGVKFPTGETKEKNTVGTRFEPELQPGSGSYDYIAGGIYRHKGGQCQYTGNVMYVLKTQGAQDYEFGDVVSTSLLAEYAVWKGTNASARLGLDTNLQYEQKHENNGTEEADSGGVKLLMGPSVAVEAGTRVSAFASLHLPAYQNLGGVHQELDYAWTAGAKVNW